MTGVTSSYEPDRPRGSSGSASSLKARFENIAKADEEVTSFSSRTSMHINTSTTLQFFEWDTLLKKFTVSQEFFALGRKNNLGAYSSGFIALTLYRSAELSWFEGWLFGRKLSAYFEYFHSSSQFVLCGVPQDSILEPLVFTIYVNEFSL